MKKKDLVKMIVDQSIEHIQKYGIEAVDVYMQLPINIVVNMRTIFKDPKIAIDKETIDLGNELLAFQLKYYHDVMKEYIDIFMETPNDEWVDLIVNKVISNANSDDDTIEEDIKRKRDLVKKA